ncbi:hypothetical protein BDZ91DRAFT_366785 [Kalaharituber pfeilii]|nr:hypothetical protein BDZ91DRAFT_366785 [Kalaharituber pfeilii]
MPVQITDSAFNTSPIFHAGRGGAGNYRKLSSSELAAHQTTVPTVIPPSTSKIFFGGRGGAGNVHPTTERAMFSFDEELERERLIHEHHAPVYSIGRGGMGNLVSCEDIATRSFYTSNGSTCNNNNGLNSANSSPRSSTSSASHHTFSAQSLKSGADRLWSEFAGSELGIASPFLFTIIHSNEETVIYGTSSAFFKV